MGYHVNAGGRDSRHGLPDPALIDFTDATLAPPGRGSMKKALATIMMTGRDASKRRYCTHTYLHALGWEVMASKDGRDTPAKIHRCRTTMMLSP